MSNSTKHLDIGIWKLRERVDDQEIYLEYCNTCQMISDLGTKALGIEQLECLRDMMNGYALVRIMRETKENKVKLTLHLRKIASNRDVSNPK